MNGLLDYFKTLNQPNQQGLTFVDRASMNPLLQAGIGILANNTGNYGQFGPALGMGVGYGLQNVGQYKQQLADNQDRQLQRTLYGQQVEAQMKKAYGDKDEDEIASGIFKTVFQDAGYDPETGGFLPVSADGQMGTSPLSGTPITQDDFAAPKPANPMDSILDELGWSAGRKKFFMSQYKADPKAAMKNLERAYVEVDRSNRKGKSEARDVIAKDRVIAQEMGISLKDYYTMKNRDRPQAQIINYGTSFTPAVDQQGNPVLLQPSKTGGQPNVVQGFMPADDAAKARQSQSAARTRFSSLDRLDADIESVKKLPGLEYAVGLYSAAPVIPGTKQADAVAAIENLASRAAVQALSDMREASKTGGAVGQVTEKEWPKLEAQLANLNRKQSLPKFIEELDKFQSMIRSSMRLIDEAQRKEPRLPSQQAAPKSSAKPAPAASGWKIEKVK